MWSLPSLKLTAMFHAPENQCLVHPFGANPAYFQRQPCFFLNFRECIDYRQVVPSESLDMFTFFLSFFMVFCQPSLSKERTLCLFLKRRPLGKFFEDKKTFVYRGFFLRCTRPIDAEYLAKKIAWLNHYGGSVGELVALAFVRESYPKIAETFRLRIWFIMDCIDRFFIPEKKHSKTVRLIPPKKGLVGRGSDRNTLGLKVTFWGAVTWKRPNRWEVWFISGIGLAIWFGFSVGELEMSQFLDTTWWMSKKDFPTQRPSLVETLVTKNA